jgi:hypothetical protein
MTGHHDIPAWFGSKITYHSCLNIYSFLHDKIIASPEFSSIRVYFILTYTTHALDNIPYFRDDLNDFIRLVTKCDGNPSENSLKQRTRGVGSVQLDSKINPVRKSEAF